MEGTSVYANLVFRLARMTSETVSERAPSVEDLDAHSERRIPRADAVRNRKLLLRAAVEAFTERGADVPLEDIARSAGVGIGTLYRHFPTRYALVEAVYRNEIDVLCARADQLLASRPPAQALGEWMQLFVQHVAAKRGMLSALKPLLSDAAFSAQTRGRVVESASKLLAAGTADGTIRSDVTGGDLLRAVGGICMSTEPATADSSDVLVRLLFDGLRRVDPD